MRSPRASLWPSPTASRSGAAPTAPTGSRSAGAASGSIRCRRSRAKPGSRSPRRAAARRARASSPPPRSTKPRSTSLFAERIATGTQLRFDPATGAVEAKSGRRLGAIILKEGRDAKADPEAIEAALVAGVREHGLGLLRWSEGSRSLRIRAAFARSFDDSLPDLSDAALMASLDDWLPALVAGKRKLGDVDPGALAGMLDALLGWDGRRTVDRLAPEQFATPAGSHHAIDYEAEGGPTVTMRPQALFGLATHPTIAQGRVPLVLSLTSPAGRPIQTTRDLPGFWAGSWAAVAKEMRGRYPRHPWPDDPARADPTLRTKRASQR